MIHVRTQAVKGRGVFTDSPIGNGSLIERCEVIEIPSVHAARLDATNLYDYYFGWGEDDNDMAIALGLGSLYNHSYSPNAVYRKNLSEKYIEFVALRDIETDEEILVNYNGDPDDRSPLWKGDEIDWVD